jgi:hypothetical protein
VLLDDWDFGDDEVLPLSLSAFFAAPVLSLKKSNMLPLNGGD